MNAYIYKLKDDTGKTLYGFMEAKDVSEVKREIRSSNLYFIKANQVNRHKVFNKKVSLEVLLTFTRRLSSLVDSGIPILAAMKILWRQSEDKTIQLVVSHIHLMLQRGKQISEAIKDFPRIFPSMYCSMISVAESAGGLNTILAKITDYLDYQRQVNMRMQKATLYPTLVIIFATLIFICMFTFVVPTFQKVLYKLDMELPLLTQFILGISAVLTNGVFWIISLLMLIVLYFVFRQLKKKQKFVNIVDTYKIRLPVLGSIFYTMSLSRFVHALSLLISSGVPIINSFELAKATTNNNYLNSGIDKIQMNVKKGNSLYKSIKDVQMFPVMFTEMTGVGETSGRMDSVLNNMAKHFDEEGDFKQNRILTYLEPMLIIFVGVIVIITLLAIYMPIFSIWQGLM